jgi:hypothetical protein
MGNVAFVDAEGLVRTYLNSVSTLCGAPPAPLRGVFLHPLRSTQSGAHGVVTQVGGYDDGGDANLSYARLSHEVRASTKEAALTAAVALANALRALDGNPQVVPSFGTLRSVTDISGPVFVPDGDEPRYVVTALHIVSP